MSDLFEVPKGLAGWEADLVFSQLTKVEVERSTRHLPLHHAQMAEGWGELLCSNLTEAYPEKFLMVESNQYFTPALALNGFYTERVRRMFTRAPTVQLVAAAADEEGKEAEEETAGAAKKTRKNKKKKGGKKLKKAAATAAGGVTTTQQGLPLHTLDIFGALSPLILRPTAAIRQKLKRFGRDSLGVGGPTANTATTSSDAEGIETWLEESEDADVPPHTVGIQLRTKDRHPMSDRQIDAFLSCAKAAAMSSSAISNGFGAGRQSPPVIFLATDRPSLRAELMERHALDGENGNPLLVWWDAPVATDIAGMHGAVLDLWLLGFADEIFMSHGSTFGYVAHGRVGMPPSIVTGTGSCVKEISAEPCVSY